MSRILYTLMLLATLASCTETYNVKGSTSLSRLDGSQLYLKTVDRNEFVTLDSCAVLHGKFQFSVPCAEEQMASLFMGEENIMPVVLEEGNIVITLTNTEQSVSGTPLNDTLYSFLDRHSQLEMRMNELMHKQNQMILDGISESEINETLTAEANIIAAEEDELVTSFIADNYDNVLGPGIFMMITSRMPYPVLTPQIEHIMSNATDKFKNHPYVSDFYRAASDNEARMQGLDASGAPLTETADSLAAAGE